MEWRRSVRTVLEAAGAEIAAEAVAGPETLDAVGREAPDIALVDVLLSGGGVMWAARLAARHPRLQIVMTAEDPDEESLFSALRAGARGYIVKTSAITRLPAILAGVMSGEVSVPRSLVAPLVEEFVRRAPRQRRLDYLPGSQRLSSQERQVVAWVIDGRSTEDIAGLMYVSPGSVRSYLSRALFKLRLESREALCEVAAHTRVGVRK